jgi:hypothetical protein
MDLCMPDIIRQSDDIKNTVGGLEIETSQNGRPIKIEISIFEFLTKDFINNRHV